MLDGFNVLITIEAALSGAVILRGADGRLRDLSSVHGTYRSVEETEAALHLLLDALRGAGEVRVVLDRPVSNSGRLAARMRALGMEVELSDQADATLLLAASRGACLVSADGPLLDRAVAAGARLADPLGPRLGARPGTWCVDLDGLLHDATAAL